MLNFLRKLRRKDMNQNTGRYLKYAIGEILLVVIGILIALGINNFNEQRKNRDKEHQLLKTLQQEFSANDSIINAGLERHQSHLDESMTFLSKIGPNSRLKAEDIFAANPASYAIVDIIQASLTSTLSTNQLELIQSETLKLLLSSYPSVLLDYKEQELLHRDLVVNDIRPRSARYVSMAELDPSLKEITTPHSSDYIGHGRDPQTQNDVVSKIWLLRNWIIPKLKLLHRKNDEVLNALQLEIKD